MSDGSFELQAAVYTALNGLTPALASGGVHAPAAQDTPLPYVELDESDTVEADVVGRQGVTETLNIHVWTAPGSYGPAKQIISRIRDALHAQKLTVSGRSYAFAIVSSTRIFNDADETAIHGVVTLTVTHFS
ncbi:MAG: DUF3168 domain-containing protein [Xanthobacteraceae bacterium]